MEFAPIITATVEEFKKNVMALCQEYSEQLLTPRSAEMVSKEILQYGAAACKDVYRAFVESKDETVQQ